MLLFCEILLCYEETKYNIFDVPLHMVHAYSTLGNMGVSVRYWISLKILKWRSASFCKQIGYGPHVVKTPFLCTSTMKMCLGKMKKKEYLVSMTTLAYVKVLKLDRITPWLWRRKAGFTPLQCFRKVWGIPFCVVTQLKNCTPSHFTSRLMTASE